MTTILVVDDRPTNRELLRTVLGYRGYRILEAGDGAAALATVRAERPDLVISDILMPTMDGFEFVRLLRQDPQVSETPVIFNSAHFLTREAATLAAACGVRHVLPKASEPEEILRVVDQVLASAPPAAGPPGHAEVQAPSFTEEHVRVMTQKLAEKVNSLRTANELLSALIEFGRQVGSESDPWRLLEGVCRSARRIIGASYAVAGSLDERGRTEAPVAFTGLTTLPVTASELEIPGDSLIGWCLAQRRAIRATEADAKRLAVGLPAAHPRVRNVLCAPIASPTRAYGWICLSEKVGVGRFNAEDERLLANLAAQAGRAHEAIALLAEARQRADALEREVAERRRTEVRLRESEQRFRMMADTMPALLWLSDRNGATTFFNRRYLDHVGDVPGHRLGVHPEDLDRVRAADTAMFRRHEATAVEYRLQGSDGTYRWFLETTAPRFDEDGEYLGHIGVLVDVAERRALEAQLRRAQRLEAIGQLTGGVAHDFNNLLTVVLGYAELLGEEGVSGDHRQRGVEAILKATGRAAELTQRLLAFSRQQILAPRPMDVHGLARGLMEILGRTLGDNIEVRLVPAELPAVASVDPAQLENVLLNLAINARDAMPSGGRLGIEAARVVLAEPQPVIDGEAPPGAYIRLSVSDTGTGMPPEVLARAIEPFFTTKDPGKGTGLGLSMVYGFAKQSGGHLDLRSVVGRGTTVTLYLPAADQDSEPAGPSGEASASTSLHGTESILVVEDHDQVREFLAQTLSLYGYQVTAVRGPAEAEDELVGGLEVDLLLSDVVLPGAIDGIELAQRLRRMRPGLRILLTSGSAGDPRIGRMGAGAGLGLLAKPYGPAELSKAVRAALGEPPAAEPPERQRARDMGPGRANRA